MFVTVPKSNRETNNVTLSEQLQSTIKKTNNITIGTGQTVWHYWFFYGTLELLQTYDIICFPIEI
jgi:hypothetical protein